MITGNIIKSKNTSITHETQAESAIHISRIKRGKMILDALGDTEMTAREIAYKLGFSDLNAVKPRLTEMRDAGIVETCGKKKDEITNRNVAVWRACNNRS